ncbi:MAG: DMT family transporter [Chloroflexi bacterium]|nr:DMT family transporter [Chloroflexota bacterium]
MKHFTKSAPVSVPLILFTGILAVSTASPLIRFAQQEAPSLVIAAWRMGLAALLLAPVHLTRNRGELVRLRKGQLALLFASGLFLALHFGTWITSLEYTTVASSVVLVTTAPLWVALFSPLVLGERLRPVVGVGLAVALAGGVVVGLSETCNIQAGGMVCANLDGFLHGRAFIGNLLALVGAWCSAGYLLIGRKVRPTISVGTYTSVVYTVSAVFLCLAALWRGQTFLGYSPETYLWLLGLAIFPQLIGHSMFNYALGFLSAAYVSVALLGEPIGSSILALFLLGEVPSALELGGGALILFGIYLVSRSETPAEVKLQADAQRPPEALL